MVIGKAQTVLGPIEGKDIGITLPHEHLLTDGRVYFKEPSEASDRGLAYKPVSLEILSWLQYHHFENLDNLQLLDEQEAIDEGMFFKEAGGNTIVDLTNPDLGRDPKALVRISRATGLNIVMSSGYYTGGSHPSGMSAKTEEQITEEIAQDITVGVGDTGICAGIIGEIGCTWPLQDNERKVLRAAARAQQLTGAPINVHPGRNDKAPLEAAGVLADAGADLSRVIMSHIDLRSRNHKSRCKLAKMGCCIEYDAWGWEGYFPLWMYDFDTPNDAQRIHAILQLIEDGYLNQIFISHDNCSKRQYVRYGGGGFVHISNHVVPLMLKRGMTNEQVSTIMIENPRRVLCFA